MTIKGFHSNVIPSEVQHEIKAMIDSTIGLAWKQLLGAIQQTDECYVSAFGYQSNSAPDYDVLMNQHLYMLKYFPAYLYEYTKMYQEIFHRALNLRMENLNVLSFGCGSGLDFYGLYFARKICMAEHISVCYYGVDLVDWMYRNLIPAQGNMQSSFSKCDIATISADVLGSYNTFVFPKSLSEFPVQAFGSLLANIQQSQFSTPLLLAASTMTIANTVDADRIQAIIKILGYNDFELTGDYSAASSKTAICLDWLFWSYPDEIKNNLQNIFEFCEEMVTCDKNCKENPRGRNPILLQDYVKCYIETLS